MFDVDTTDAVASLRKYQQEMKVKFEQMVVRVVRLWSTGIIEVSPVGDSLAYKEFYEAREEDGWAMTEGLLLGNWKIRNGTTATTNYIWNDQDTDTTGMNIAKEGDRFAAEFKLGQVITVYNATPYINSVAVRNTRGQQIRDIRYDAELRLMQTYQTAYAGLN